MAEVKKPRIRIRDAVPRDVDAIVDIHFAAFGPNIMNQLLHPGGATEDARRKIGSTFFPKPDEKTAATDKPKSSGESIVMVAELLPDADDAGDGGHTAPEIVAYARWMLHREARSEEEWNVVNKPRTAENLGAGTNVELFNLFIGGLHQMRQKWARGDPGLFLGTLASTPTRARLGAASALVQWGADLMDKEGLVGWLEASPAGYALYRRFDFEDVDVQDLDIARFGAAPGAGQDWGTRSAVALAGPLPQGIHRSVLMKRIPKRS